MKSSKTEKEQGEQQKRIIEEYFAMVRAKQHEDMNRAVPTIRAKKATEQ